MATLKQASRETPEGMGEDGKAEEKGSLGTDTLKSHTAS